jgi:hypothetical protein
MRRYVRWKKRSYFEDLDTMYLLDKGKLMLLNGSMSEIISDLYLNNICSLLTVSKETTNFHDFYS